MTSSVIYVCHGGTMRADRLLSMIWLLRTHGGLSTAELAQRLEVSRRTVLRDVEALSTAGVPVYCERGAHGGVRLLPDYRTDVTGLSEDESRALFAAISSWGPDSIGLGDAFASGVRKLLAAVPDAYRDLSIEVASRIVIDPHGWLPRPKASQLGDGFATVQAGVFARQRLQLTYHSRRTAAVQEVVVEPHGLVSAGSDWYLCASEDERVRFFKIVRIESVVLLAEPCSGPEINVEEVWQEHRARFLDQFTPVVVDVWIRSKRWEEACEWTMRFNEVEAFGGPPGDGWLPVRLEFMDDLHAVTILLRLGSDVRVEAPVEVKAKLLDHADQIAALYRS